jgi:hypothetical protein
MLRKKEIEHVLTGITLTMCKTCHKRFHPTCTSHISATRPGDRMCDRCLHCQATLVCPQCSGMLHEDSLFSFVFIYINTTRSFRRLSLVNHVELLDANLRIDIYFNQKDNCAN